MRKLIFRTQVNANRTYFYPACEASQKLCDLMKRKALVGNDRGPLLDFIDTIDLPITVEILPPETPEHTWG